MPQCATPDSPPTLAMFWAAWLPRHALTVRRSTVALYQYAFDRFLADLGAHPLPEVSRDMLVDRFARMARDGQAPNTVQLCRAAISACLRDAAEQRPPLIPVHPLLGLRMRGRAASVRQAYVYSDAELAAFLATAARKRPDLAPCFALQAKAGHRPGEALAQRVTDLNLEARTALIERTAHDDGVTGPTKTGKTRVVDLCDSLVKMLAVHTESRDGWLFPAKTRKGPKSYRTLWFAMREIADSAGVPRTTPHSLRHYAAGAMLQLGLPLLYVSRQLGHAKIGMTAETYANHLRFKRPRELDGW